MKTKNIILLLITLFTSLLVSGQRGYFPHNQKVRFLKVDPGLLSDDILTRNPITGNLGYRSSSSLLINAGLGLINNSGTFDLGGTTPQGSDILLTLGSDLPGSPRPDATTFSILNDIGEGIVLTNNNLLLSANSVSLNSITGNTNINAGDSFNLFVQNQSSPGTFRPHFQALTGGGTLINAYENQNLTLITPPTGGIVFNNGQPSNIGDVWTKIDNFGRGEFRPPTGGGAFTAGNGITEDTGNPGTYDAGGPLTKAINYNLGTNNSITASGNNGVNSEINFAISPTGFSAGIYNGTNDISTDLLINNFNTSLGVTTNGGDDSQSILFTAGQTDIRSISSTSRHGVELTPTTLKFTSNQLSTASENLVIDLDGVVDMPSATDAEITAKGATAVPNVRWIQNNFPWTQSGTTPNIVAATDANLVSINNGKLLIDGVNENAIVYKRTGTIGTGNHVDPIFETGRIVGTGIGEPTWRILYRDSGSDTNEYLTEALMFAVEPSGTAASVRRKVGSHFEGFIDGEVEPFFRIESIDLDPGAGITPSSRIRMGAGGSSANDVELIRRGANQLSLALGGSNKWTTFADGFQLEGGITQNFVNTATTPSNPGSGVLKVYNNNGTMGQLNDSGTFTPFIATNSYGSMGWESNTTETVITTVGTYTKIEGTSILSSVADFTHTNGRLTYIGNNTKTFLLAATVSIESSANNQIVRLKYAKNGVVEGFSSRRKINSTTDVGAQTILYDVPLSTNDYIELFIDNETSTNNLTVTDFYLRIVSH